MLILFLGSRKSSASSVLQSLDAASKANRVAELLAKVRNKTTVPASPSASASPTLSVSSSVDRLSNSSSGRLRAVGDLGPAAGSRSRLTAPTGPRPLGIAEEPEPAQNRQGHDQGQSQGTVSERTSLLEKKTAGEDETLIGKNLKQQQRPRYSESNEDNDFDETAEETTALLLDK